MKIKCKMLRRVVFSAIGAVFLSVASYSHQLPQASSKEDLLKTTYHRLTFYNGAANAQQAAENGAAYDTQSDLRFQIRNVRTGPIRDIADKPIGQMVDKPHGDVIEVRRIIRSFNRGPEHVMYQAKWVVSGYTGSLLEDWENTSVARMLQLTDKSDVSEYTSYEVTVRLDGRERTYKAMALHHDSFQSAAEPRTDFLDNVIGQTTLGHAFTESRPPVKAPWMEYVKSDAYRTYVQSKKKALSDPQRRNEDDQTNEQEITARSSEPLLPETCDFFYSLGPERGKYRVDQQFHTSLVSWGQHDVRSAMQGLCRYDQNCYVNCSVANTNLEVTEVGFPSSACHQWGSNILFEDATAPEHDGANCAATVGVGFKACLFCACSVSVTITPITVSSDGFWTYQHKLTHKCPCMH